jgi:hypothetical protein
LLLDDGMRGRSLEDWSHGEQEKRNDLAKAIAAAAAAAGTPVLTLSWDFHPLSFDQ